jgi:hypothetical protein
MLFDPSQHPPPTAVFAGCARDCVQTLPHVLANVDAWAAAVTRPTYIWVENDSKDGTKTVLKEWSSARANAIVLELDGLGAAERARTRRLEFARNAVLQLVRAHQLGEADFLVWLDMDVVNATPADLPGFKQALHFMCQTPEASGVFVNQNGPYYDLWALRHPQRCPVDVWEEVCDYALSHGVSDESACEATLNQRRFTLPMASAPLEVDSAFGGLAIYRMSHVLANPNPYLGEKVKAVVKDGVIRFARWQTCEHVHFNQGLRRGGGRLFVMPSWTNGETETHGDAPSIWRGLFF